MWQAMLLLVGFIGVMLFILFYITSGSLKHLIVMIEKSYENLETYLNQRLELSKELFNMSKDEVTQDSKNVEKIIISRGEAPKDIEDRAKSEVKLANAVDRLLYAAEKSAVLKEDAAFLTLKEQIEDNEEDIYQAQKYYNQIVRHYNQKMRTFPSKVIVRVKKYERAAFYDMEDPDEKKRRRK